MSVVAVTVNVKVLLFVVPTVSVVSCAVLMKVMMNIVAMGSLINLMLGFRMSSLLRLILPMISLLLMAPVVGVVVPDVWMNGGCVLLVSAVIACSMRRVWLLMMLMLLVCLMLL